jgi:hypothetical protein
MHDLGQKLSIRVPLISSQFVKHVEKFYSLFGGHLHINIDMNILFRKEDGFYTYSLKEKAFQ